MRRLCLATTVGAVLTLTAIAGPATAATPKRSSSKIKLSTKTTTTKLANGATRIHFVYGPVHIAPGQNSIFIEPNDQRPKVDGYVTRFAPNLILQDGTIPRVDQIHLHHAVWLVNRRPTWGAGEEKTTAATPKGYGWEYKTSDEWLMNHMIHDLLPTPETVYITYDMDFIPKSSPKAAGIIPIRTQWMDVVGGGYPVFDALKGQGEPVVIVVPQPGAPQVRPPPLQKEGELPFPSPPEGRAPLEEEGAVGVFVPIELRLFPVEVVEVLVPSPGEGDPGRTGLFP